MVVASTAENAFMFDKSSSILIGKVISYDNKILKVKPIHFLRGVGNKSDIYIYTKDLKYDLLFTKPTREDICVVSIEKLKQHYKIKNGIYKTDSKTEIRYAKIKLERNDLYKNFEKELILLDYFINNNGKPIKIEGDKYYKINNDGSKTRFYPELKKYLLITVAFFVITGVILFKKTKNGVF